MERKDPATHQALKARGLALCLLLASLGLAAATPPENALALLRAAEVNQRGDTSTSRYHVDVVRPDWHKTLRLEGVDDRIHDRYGAKVLAPRKSRGIRFLKVGERLWMILPKLRRRIAISPAMLAEPWLGSDLSNQDLLQASSLIDDYHHRITGNETRDGHRIYTIESRPREDRPALWGRLVQRVRDDGVPVSVDYYDAQGKRIRTLRFDQVKEIEGHRIPTRWVMTPAAPPGQYTELRLDEIHFNRPIDPAWFQGFEQKNAP